MKFILRILIFSCIASSTFAFQLPQPEPYFTAVSPIFGYDPVYGLLIGGAWFSYPTGEVAKAKTHQDLNFISSLKANGAINWAQQNPNAWGKSGYSFSLGVNNFYDYTTFENSNEIAETNKQVTLNGRVHFSYQINELLSASIGINNSWQTHQSDGENWDSFFNAKVKLDQRDDPINSQQGWFIQPSFNYRHPALANKWQQSGRQVKLDGRYFLPIGEQQTLALRGVSEHAFGTGFSSSPGGSEILRGYLPNQYTAKNMLALQSEYRFPIWSFIRGVAFVEAAKLFDKHNSNKQSLANAGIGLRFGLPPDQSISVRWDNAVNQQGQWLSYVNFNQVF